MAANLVVVTFTHRAADEMQRRARKTILEAGVSLDVLAAFDHAFFGTIHSFCVKLLNDYGHYLGLPPHLDLITDDGELGTISCKAILPLAASCRKRAGIFSCDTFRCAN